MSILLRRPAAVPALFSPGVERETVRHPRARAFHGRYRAAENALLPALLFMAELPLIKGAVLLLSLSLPH